MPISKEEQAVLDAFNAPIPQSKPIQPEEQAVLDAFNSPSGPSQIEAALRGGAQGASLGFSDELTGAGLSIPTALNPSELAKQNTGNVLQDLLSVYRSKRDEQRAADVAAKEAFPKTYLGGEIVGSGATAFVPGLNAINSVKGMTALGGLAGLGSSTADLTRPSQETLQNIANDASLGAAIGGTIGGGFKLLGKGKELLSDIPLMKQIGKAYKAGKAGENIVGETPVQNMYKDVLDTSQDMGLAIEAERKYVGAQREAIERGLNPEDPTIINHLRSEVPFGDKLMGEIPQVKLAPTLNPALKEISAYQPVSEGIANKKNEAVGLINKIISGETPTTPLSRALDLKQELNDIAQGAQKESSTKLFKLTSDLEKQIGKTMNEQVAGLKEINSKYGSLKEAQNIFTQKRPNILEQAKSDRKLAKILEKSSDDSFNAFLQKQNIEQGMSALENANPQMADKFRSKIAPLMEKYDLVMAANESSLGKFGLTGRIGTGGANIVGQMQNAVTPKALKYASDLTKRLFSNVPVKKALLQATPLVPTIQPKESTPVITTEDAINEYKKQTTPQR